MGANAAITSLNILVVDEHAVVREGIRELFADQQSVVIAEASSVAEATAALSEFTPHVCIIELNLDRGLTGFDLLRYMSTHAPRAAVVVFTTYRDAAYARRAVHSGAFAYVTKCGPLRSLHDAVLAAAAGRPYLQEFFTGAIKLTAREQQIMELLGDGLSMTTISAKLGIAYKTVNNSATRMRDKLGLVRTSDLVRYALETRNTTKLAHRRCHLIPRCGDAEGLPTTPAMVPR